MNAVEVLRAARAVGIRVEIDGENLMLQASVPPPSAVVSALASLKPDIVSLLRSETNSAGELGMEKLEERAALVEYGAGVPKAWAEGFARLDLAIPPNGFDHRRWRTLIDDGGRFLDRWGAEAASHGWSAEDVFGVHPAAPGASYDTAGLVVLINGGDVVDIDHRSASIKTRSSGAILVYLRTPRNGSIALWELTSL